MIPGNLNSKLSERQSKATKKQISHNAQKNKELPEKTAFALCSNSDNCKPPKTGDEKVSKFLPQNKSLIKSDLRQDPFRWGKAVDAGNPGRGPISAQSRSYGRHVIKPATTSAPVIAGTATMTRFSSVTLSKIPLSKKTIEAKRHAELNKVSNETKTNDPLAKPGCTPTKNSSKIDVNSNKLTGLKKSATCPPCVKLEQDVNHARAKTTLGWNLPKTSRGNFPKPEDKTRSLSREPAERKNAKDTPRDTSKERPILAEVKRMKSEGDSIVSRTTRFSARTPAILPRQAASEVKDFSKYNFHTKPGPAEEISAIDPTEKKGMRLFKTGVKNHVLRVHTADFVVTGREIKEHSQKPDSDVNQSPRRDSSDHQNLPGHSSLQPIEYYDSFDSIERKNREDEISGPGEKDLEQEILGNWEKTDFLYSMEDDLSDSFSDICQLHSVHNEQGPNADKFGSGSKTYAPSTKKAHSPDFKADEKLPQKGADEENEEFWPQKNIDVPSTKSPEPEKEPVITDSKKGKPSKADQSLRDHGNRISEEGQISKLAPTRGSEAEVSCIPSEFFRTHKNLGFIGKEEDEEHVSFDPALVTLYQPRETQMLFYDLANCVATQAYLKMCGINYVLAERKNAEHMSPSGKIPFVSSCLCIIPEFEGIVSFMQYKKYSCVRVRECDKAAFRATVSMIVDTLEVAERYICWYDEETVITYTKPTVGGLFPFPLNHVIYWKKRYEERKRLALEETKQKSFDAVLSQINYCFNTLSQLLGENSFFFGDASSEIDALVYGHIYAAFTTKQEGLFRDLQFIIKQFPNLIMFAINFDKMFLLNKFSSLNLPLLG